MGDSILCVGDDEESRIAEKRLIEYNFAFQKRNWTQEELVQSLKKRGLGLIVPPIVDIYFSNTLNRPLIPSLFSPRAPYFSTWEAFLSLEGVNSVVRWQFVKEFPNQERLRDQIKTFYGINREVTCFDQEGEPKFKGHIDNAPHDIKGVLSRHDYSYWHEVGSWDLGNLEKLTSQTNDPGIIRDEKKRLILFPEEIDKLKQGELVVLNDHRCMYEVEFEALQSQDGNLIRFLAHMFD